MKAKIKSLEDKVENIFQRNTKKETKTETEKRREKKI